MTCIRCGNPAEMSGDQVCQSCMRAWQEKNVTAWDIVAAEIGPDSPQNHEAFVKRLKQVKRELAKGNQ